VTQLTESLGVNPRLAELHSATGDRIEHPPGYRDDIARLAFNVNDFA
jgi:hypothetical protein